MIESWGMPRIDLKKPTMGLLSESRDELQKTEELVETVIIIAQIPSQDSDCLHSWSVRMKALVERYEHVVRLQFYGHSHDERWHMNRGFEDGHPIGIQFGTASLGTRGGKNPGFRIFELDAETLLPVEITRYWMKLDESNESGVAQWSKMYDLTEEYQLESFSPTEIYNFVQSWPENPDWPKRYKMNRDGRFEYKTIDEVPCDA